MNDIKAIFFDIDGTLLPIKGTKLPLSTKESLAALRAKGIKVLIATGRYKEEIETLPVMEAKFDGYLTLNGQLCLDESLHAYSGNPIDKGEMEVLSGIFRAHKIPFIFIGADERYINYVNDSVVNVQNDTNGKVPKVGTYHGEDIYQICAFVNKHQKELLASILDDCNITSWNPLGIDIVPKGGGKQAGIQAYMEANGLKPENIMAFGDGENDIEMLKFAGIGVAMGNASDSVKAIADYVTDNVEDGGIKHALQHFGLID